MYKCSFQQLVFFKIFQPRHFYCKVMDSILENISFADCCAISMSKRWNLIFFMTHVRKVMSFDYSNFSRYTFSMLLLWSREEIYQIITVKYWIRIKVCAANLLLLLMCVLLLCNEYFKQIFQNNFLQWKLLYAILFNHSAAYV